MDADKLARKWNFPEELTSAIAFHHFPDFEVAHKEIVRIVCAADLFAHLMEFKVLEPGLVSSLEEEGRIPVELSHVEVEEIFTQLKVEIAESRAFLAYSASFLKNALKPSPDWGVCVRIKILCNP